ncbi:hypothetical protein RDWZM_008297 [Blomia tropicalis]|uniref:Transmembrane protein n=1 Tax=Blomia tropicalis TaxID=40697 RepID=A0A9Q0M0R1_BLOTA|nr:hypothetical protein RDWZM_008297 [Blomia tropicalis]
MNLNVNNIEIFARDDNKLDRFLKLVVFINSFLIFINAFFGYWISLNESEFGRETGNWAFYTFLVILFYINLKVLSFFGILTILYQWKCIIFAIISGIFGALFFIGLLIGPGMRANVFCFILLFFGTIIYAIFYFHMKSIENCKSQGHRYNCRASCIRNEKIQFVDKRFFGDNGKLIKMFATYPNEISDNRSRNDTLHISFSNEPEASSSVYYEASTEKRVSFSNGNFENKTEDGVDVTKSEINSLINSQLSTSASRQQQQQTNQDGSISQLDANSLLQM